MYQIVDVGTGLRFAFRGAVVPGSQHIGSALFLLLDGDDDDAAAVVSSGVSTRGGRQLNNDVAAGASSTTSACSDPLRFLRRSLPSYLT